MLHLTALPPLSLYVHFPWCVRKCPYCDFNSHPLKGELPEASYVEALLADLELDLPRIGSRPVQTIFLGGGTPSLFSPQAIDRLLSGIRARVPLAPDAEITLEANPGASDMDRFAGYRAAGVNRLSIGIQSFEAQKLAALGRIHGREEAWRAAEAARDAGFANFNLDLMFGLPEQDAAAAANDLDTALSLTPPHLSVYQLTLEPNTPFHARPPVLPDEDTVAAMQESLQQRLLARGYLPYEVSAWSLPDRQCRHNRNYWEFGDYLGIGAGAHAKISGTDRIVRLARRRQPNEYLTQAGIDSVLAEIRHLSPDDAVFEFMLNALRLVEGVPAELFTERTGLPVEILGPRLEEGQARGLLVEQADRFQPTARGQRFLNDLVSLFLPGSTASSPARPMGNRVG